MKVIKNDRFNETIYHHVLDNGLTVYINHKPGFNNTVCCFSTSFGAINLNQQSESTNYHWNAGLAHFLEHKLFEKQDVDVLSLFTELGANANAYTSYQETNYYFSTSNGIEKPLNLLLDFVQTIDLTKESVEKEKGIIIEELKMYQEIPNFRLIMSSFDALYHNHPLKYDIAGSEKSVMAITKEELDLAYSLNYHPSQMVLTIASSIDPLQILQIIKDNQDQKSFPNINPVFDINTPEVNHVFKNDLVINMNVKQNKYSITYKLDEKSNTRLEAYRKTLIMRLILDMNFSSLDDYYQKYLDSEIINDSFGANSEFGLDYGFLQFVGESQSLEIFEDFIDHKVQDLRISSIQLEQLKKRYLGQNISDLGDFESVVFDLAKAFQLETSIFDLIEMIETITINDLETIKNSLNFDHKSKVVITSKKKS